MSNWISNKVIFNGFSKKLPQYLSELNLNNNRKWFEDNRDNYEALIKKPVKDFLTAIEAPLLSLRENINVDPRRSVFRIYRDARFTQNKAPYKPWVSMLFWEGMGKKTENPGFYLRITGSHLLIGWGFHIFTKPLLEAYRKDITSENWNKAFTKMIKKLQKQWFNFNGEHYKRYPTWYCEDDPNSDFLRYRGLSIMHKLPIPKELYTKQFIQFCMDIYTDLLVLHEWLMKLTTKV